MMNEDYGTYQCFATNDLGTSLSKPFKVKESSESWIQVNCWYDLNIFLLQHKAIGIEHKFKKLRSPSPYTNDLYIELQEVHWKYENERSWVI